MIVTTRIETLSPDGLLDIVDAVHVRDLLAACELPSDAWSGLDYNWNLQEIEGTEVELPEPNSPAALEVPWASDCWGRILCNREGWNNSEWSIEQDGILISPIYEEDSDTSRHYQVHLVKATRSGVPSRRDLWLWVAELKAHCYLMKTPHGVLHVFYAGNPDSGPVAMLYEVEFTQAELDRMWKLIMDLRTAYRVPRATRKPPGTVV
jgi:hypothetical protein